MPAMGMAAKIERIAGFIRIIGHLRQITAAFCKRLALIDVAATLRRLSIAVDPFLKSGVVKLPLRFADRRKSRVLTLVGEKAVFIGQKHLVILPIKGVKGIIPF